jgi:hypothetical protein
MERPSPSTPSLAGPIIGILALATAGILGAKFVDAGQTSSWPMWGRFLWASGLILAAVGAVILLHSIISPEHSDLGPELESDRRGPTLRRGLLIGTAIVLLVVAAAVALEAYAGIDVDRTFLAGFGVAAAWCTLRKPWWFWGHWKAHFLRSIVGDAATTVIYLAIAALALYGAVFADLSSSPR